MKGFQVCSCAFLVGVFLAVIVLAMVPAEYLARPSILWAPELPANFDFRVMEAGVQFSLAQYPGPCLVEERELGHYWRVRFLHEGKEILGLNGSRTMTFRADGGVLYVAHILESASGGNAAAYSLTDGRRLWQTQLEAVGPITHKLYRSLVTVDLTPRTVVITGRESYGDYVEILDRKTGEQLAHKLYRHGFQEPPPGFDPFIPE